MRHTYITLIFLILTFSFNSQSDLVLMGVLDLDLPTDEALIFAHYDVLTKRPTTRIYF